MRHACPVSSRQLRSLNHVVVSPYHVLEKNLMSILLKSPRSVLKWVESMTLLTMCMVIRKDKSIKRYSLNSSEVCEICSLIVK